jgi:hypothetical protein
VHIRLTEGSLTIWTDETQTWDDSEKRREEKRREGKGREEKRRRKKIKEEKVRRKKIQAREKVGKQRNNAFFQ